MTVGASGGCLSAKRTVLGLGLSFVPLTPVILVLLFFIACCALCIPLCNRKFLTSLLNAYFQVDSTLHTNRARVAMLCSLILFLPATAAAPPPLLPPPPAPMPPPALLHPLLQAATT